MVRQRSIDRLDGVLPEGSLRLCAATRVERSPDDLIRFVAGPEGIVPDLARRLPGRGVWVTADRESVAKAVKSKAFARSLKAPVAVADDLAARVDGLLERRAAEALSLANKAGSVVTGFEKIDRRLVSGDITALVHGSDAADGGREKLDRKFVAIAGGERAAGRIVTLLTIPITSVNCMLMKSTRSSSTRASNSPMLGSGRPIPLIAASVITTIPN